MQVTLTPQEWQQVLAILGDAPWRIANPLLMKIGDQLRIQQTNNSPTLEEMRARGEAPKETRQ